MLKLNTFIMKNFLIFLAGFVSGIICLFLISLAVASGSNDDPQGIPGLTMFEQPADVIPSDSFEVLQVVSGGNALANAGEKSYGGSYTYYGMVVLFIADENTHYYDDQMISVPRGKCVRQIGTYQYETKMGYKTVPAVAIFDN